MAPLPAAALAAIADALFNPDALTTPFLGRLPPPTHPGASVTSRDNAVVASSRDNNPATPAHPDTLAHPIPEHTTPTLSDGASVTPRDNAVVDSRDNNRASVTSCNNAVVVPRDNDPATPTHRDVMAQPLPGYTTPTPFGEASVTSCDNAVVASCDNPATVIPHDNANFSFFRFLGGAGAHTLMMVFLCAGRMLRGKPFPAPSVAAGPCRTCYGP
jgi:hypothetical protein